MSEDIRQKPRFTLRAFSTHLPRWEFACSSGLSNVSCFLHRGIRVYSRAGPGVLRVMRLQLLQAWIRRPIKEVLDELRVMMTDLKAKAELAKRHAAECQRMSYGEICLAYRSISISMRCDSAVCRSFMLSAYR